MRRLAFLAAILLPAFSARAGDPVRLAPGRDGIEITEDTVFAPGTHLIAERDGTGCLVIRTDGVTLDLGGATLRGAPEGAAPDTLEGVGILVENAQGVTIENGRVAGFKVGVRAVNAEGLVVEGVDASGNFKQRLQSTPEREDASDWLWPHENDEGEWETKYGAGISLNDCKQAEVRRCRVRHGQNGVLLTRCTKCYVYDDDFSFNSGWGIALYRTTHSEVSHNRCDFCVRGHSYGVYRRGQDSAAILVFEQSSHNLFVDNSATHSGDGFFLYAGHETTQRTGKGGCNFNRVFGNDFRFAVANGIEATFSEGNVFADNDCSGADHGIWAGYSYRSRFLFNRAHECMTAGISVEHGHGNHYVGNDIRGARYGIHLWWDKDREFLGSIYGRTQNCSSSDNGIHWNALGGDVSALRLDGDTGTRVTFNHLPSEMTRIQFLGSTRTKEIAHNARGRSLIVENRTGRTIDVVDDIRPPESYLLTEGPVNVVEGPPPPRANPPPPPEAPPVRGRLYVRLLPTFPSGRDQMRIDEWGPVDPRETRLFPSWQAAAGAEARVHLLGRESFEIVGLSEGVTAEPRQGRAPATLVVRAAGDGPALRPFRVTVATGGQRLTAGGSVLRMPWDVRWFGWDEATDPIAKPEAFAALLAGEPAARKTVDSLDWPWRGGGPEGVAADRFATLATSEVGLPAGRWRLRVVSDDGLRLFVDGEQVIERWDRHAPTEDVAEVDLEAGAHTFRLEHFEIDGWAWLSFRLERAD